MNQTTFFITFAEYQSVLLECSVIAFAVVVGAIWRRMFGGWLGVSKTAVRWSVVAFTAPAWVTWPWWQALILAGLLAVYFSLGQDFNRPLKVLWRYTLPLIAFSLAVGLFWALPATLVPTLAAWLLRKQTVVWDPIEGGPVDGWEAVWELCLGASALGIAAAAGMMTHGWAWG